MAPSTLPPINFKLLQSLSFRTAPTPEAVRFYETYQTSEKPFLSDTLAVMTAKQMQLDQHFSENALTMRHALNRMDTIFTNLPGHAGKPLNSMHPMDISSALFKLIRYWDCGAALHQSLKKEQSQGFLGDFRIS